MYFDRLSDCQMLVELLSTKKKVSSEKRDYLITLADITFHIAYLMK